GFRPRSATKLPKTARAASRATAEMTAVSAHAAPRTWLLLEAGLADGALHQEVHRELELVVVVGDDLTLFEDDIALVVFERALVELERVVDEALLQGEDLRSELLRHRPTERTQRDHVLLEPAAQQIRIARSVLPRLDEARAGRPVPFGAGEEALGSQLGDVGVIAARVDPAPLGVLDDDLRGVHVGDDDVHALIDQAVRHLGLANRVVPIAGDDDLTGDGGIHRAGAEDEAVGVVEDEVDGLAADEPDLSRLRHVTG